MALRWFALITAIGLCNPLVSSLLLPASADAGQLPSTADRAALYAELERDAQQLDRWSHVLRKIVRLISPTVVHIDTEKNDRYSRRYGPRHWVEEAGSGVVIEHLQRYYVLTNWHVVRDAAMSKINVKLADSRVLSPTSVWHDAATDVAVLAISAENLVAAHLGNSDLLEIGDFVLAVGSPFGLSNSVTYGILSAKGRRDLELGDEGVRYQDFLQTDAAINPGNSGGPLINLRGEVVGINTAIASNSGGNEGIGFSIPINMVMAIARQLIEHGSVERAFLGVKVDSRFGPDVAAKLGLGRVRGARISVIIPNSPAAAVPLRVGDVILRFNDVDIEDDAHLINVVSHTKVGSEVPVVVYREQKEVVFQIKVTEQPRVGPQSSVEPTPREGRAMDLVGLEAWDVDVLGLTLVGIDASVASRFELAPGQVGLLVVRVDAQGPMTGQIQRGEIIEEFDDQPVRRIEDLERVMAGSPTAAGLRLKVTAAQSDQAQASRTVVIKPDMNRLR